MEKKKSSERKFKSASEMDRFLENSDLAVLFEKHGKVEKPKIKKVNVDLPEWLVSALDFEADRVGISRQPLIKLWLVQKLDEQRKRRPSL